MERKVEVRERRLGDTGVRKPHVSRCQPGGSATAHELGRAAAIGDRLKANVLQFHPRAVVARDLNPEPMCRRRGGVGENDGKVFLLSLPILPPVPGSIYSYYF